MIMLEGAKATTETVDALRTGASAMKAMQKATYVLHIFILLAKFAFWVFPCICPFALMLTVLLKCADLQFVLLN